METKLEYTKCVPSVTMDDIIQNIKEEYKEISTCELNDIMQIIPVDMKYEEKYKYIKHACEWFMQGIAIPLIKQYIINLINKKYEHIKIEFQR